jgi:hypothetical protein
MQLTARRTATIVFCSAISVFAAGCTRDFFNDDEEAPKRVAPIRLPAKRISRRDEERLLKVLDDVRGVDAEFLARAKAEDTLQRLLADDPTGSIDYVVQLLDDPQWGVRAIALRMLMAYGRGCPAAVSALVQVIGDNAMNAAVRADAEGVLRKWTGNDYDYHAWETPERRRVAVRAWKQWLDETHGVIPPPAEQ